ncbi:energy transducer TonB family protein [Mesorhizobium xinjiangense]|uniref:energy transducer TonB family protein n=1 Tax=Mesorhizobium xinjiangense TaxID=2678685 RepID=UPI0012EDF6DF|nr:energy transducer TonB [Mesorhizobium xinjiangense]
MKPKGWHWAVAIVVSCIVHAGAASYLLDEDKPLTMTEGASGLEVAMLGSFEDAVSAGEPVETTETLPPTETEVQPVEPVNRPETAEPAKAAEVEPTPSEPAEVTDVAPSEPTTEAQVLVPVTQVEPEKADEPEEVQQAALAPVETAEPVEAQPETTEPDLAIPDSVPTPTARPEPPVEQAVVKPERVEPRPKKTEAPKAKRSQRSSGSRGKQTQDTRRGQADGQSQARSGASGRGQSGSGSAAVSNYPGKIVSKLRRSLRYPSAARRKRVQGEVHVQFTVSANGGVRGIRVVRSSGSPVLDKAAIDTVRRAAPFPSIPRGAGRASWPFTVPLAFRR